MNQTILVVEDDVQIRKFICYCLENNNYQDILHHYYQNIEIESIDS